jgi:hypothetical protein
VAHGDREAGGGGESCEFSFHNRVR